MKIVNDETRRAVGYSVGDIAGEPDVALTIGQYYDSFYKPYLDLGVRKSTRFSYNKIWELWCQPLADKKLTSFRPIDGDRFLMTLYKRLGRNTIASIKSLLSGLFHHAISPGERLEVNIWREVKIDAKKVRRPKEHDYYSVSERDAILAVIKRKDARVYWCFCTVLGMRPSEAVACKWENIDWTATPFPTIRIREAASYGWLAETKTERSLRTLLIVEPLLKEIKA